jgi:hypothetical protein
VKISKLAINVRCGANYSGEEWAFETQLKCLVCCVPLETPADLVPLINFMLQANLARFQSSVEGWEADLTSCHHTKSLVQQAVKKSRSRLSPSRPALGAIYWPTCGCA